MAENRNLHVTLQVDANTKAAQANFNQLQTTLKSLSQNTISINTDSMQQASKAAQELQIHLEKAFNVNTGQLDLNKFSASLTASKKSLLDYKKSLEAIGPSGQQAFLELAQSIALADAPLVKANTKLTEFLGTLKNTARWQISSSILHGFMGAISEAMGYAKDLNESLTNIQVVTQKSNEEMAAFAQSANRAAQSLSTTTTKYTNASLIYFQQGLNAKEVEERTQTTIKMMHAAGTSAEEASSQLTAIWNNFYDGSKSLEYYADVITALGAATASSSEEISSGLQKFASIGETVGLSYEYAASAMATITATSRESADTVGNALKTLFSRIQGLKLGETLEDGVDLNKYSAALEKVGVHVLEANGELRDMDGILNDLMDKWGELDRAQQTALAQTVAGQRQYAQFMTLMNNSDFFRENLQTAYGSEGTLGKQAEIWENSWKASSERVKASLESIYNNLIDEKFFIGLNNGLAKFLQGINGVIEGVGGLKGILTIVSGIIINSFAKEAPNALSKLSESFMIVTGQAQKMAEETRTKLLTALNEATSSKNGKQAESAEYQLQIEKLAEVVSLKQDLAAKQKNLTDAQKQEYDLIIKTVEAEYDRQISLGKTIDKLKQVVQASKNEAFDQGFANSNNTSALSKSLDDLEAYAKKLAQIQDVQKQVQNEVNSWDTQNTPFETLRQQALDYLTSLEKAGKVEPNSQAWIDLKNNISNTVTSTAELKAEMDKISDKSFSGIVNSLDDVPMSAEQAKQAVDNLVNELTSESGKYKIDKTIIEAIVGNAKDEQQARELLERLRQDIDRTANKVPEVQISFSRMFGQSISTLMSFSAQLNSMKSAFNTFGDSGADAMQKVTAGIGLMMTTANLARNAFNLLSPLLTTLGLGFGPIAGIVAGVTVAFTALSAVLAKNADDAKKAKEALEKQAKAAKDAATQQQAIYDAYKEEKTSNEELFKSYQDLLEEYQKTGKGKEALTEAALAVVKAYDLENGAIDIALGNYDLLINKVQELTKEETSYWKQKASENYEAQAESAGSSYRATDNKHSYTHQDSRLYFSSVDNELMDFIENIDSKTKEEVENQLEIWRNAGDASASIFLEEFENIFNTVDINEVDGFLNWHAAGLEKFKQKTLETFTEIGKGSSLMFGDGSGNAWDSGVNDFIEKALKASGYDNYTKGTGDFEHGGLTLNFDADGSEAAIAAYEEIDAIIKYIRDHTTEEERAQSELYTNLLQYQSEAKEGYDILIASQQELINATLADFDNNFEDNEKNIEKAVTEATKAIEEQGIAYTVANKAAKEYFDKKYAVGSEKIELSESSAGRQSGISDEELNGFWDKYVSDATKEFFADKTLTLDVVAEAKLKNDPEAFGQELDTQVALWNQQIENSGMQDEISSQLGAVLGNSFKSGMNFEELQHFKFDSGIDWGKVLNIGDLEVKIIEWNDFLKMSESEQEAYLDNLGYQLQEASVKNLEITGQNLEEQRQLAEDSIQPALNELNAANYAVEHYYDTAHGAGENYQQAVEYAQAAEKAYQDAVLKEANLADQIDANTAAMEEQELNTKEQLTRALENIEKTTFKESDIISAQNADYIKQYFGIDLNEFGIQLDNGRYLITNGAEELNQEIHSSAQKLREGMTQIFEFDSANASSLFERQLNQFKSVGIDTSGFEDLESHIDSTTGKIDKSSEAYQAYCAAVAEYNGILDTSLLENIRNFKDLKAISDQLTPEEFEAYRAYFEETRGWISEISSADDFIEKITPGKDGIAELENVSEDYELIKNQISELTPEQFLAIGTAIDDNSEQAKFFEENLGKIKISADTLTEETATQLKEALGEDLWNQLIEGINLSKASLEDLNTYFKTGIIDSETYAEAAIKILSNEDMTTEERINALNKLIEEGADAAKIYSEEIKQILGDDTKTTQQKMKEVNEKTDAPKEDLFSSNLTFAQDSTLDSQSRIKALEYAKEAMDALGESATNTRKYAEAVMKASQDAGDTAEETATKMFEAFGGANMDPDNWVTFGNMIETILSDMEGDAETKMKFIQELLEGTGLSIEQLQIDLDSFGELDLSGKSLSELRSKDEYKNDSGYDKAVEDALELETNIYAVRAALEAGQISSEQFTEKVQKLFESGDISLEEAINAIYAKLDSGKITTEEASDAIDELLNQDSVTTEQRLEEINRKIKEGIADADDYSEKLKLIMEDDTKTDQTKLNELMSKDENGEYIYSAEDREAGLSSLLDSETLSYEQLAEVMKEVNLARQELNYSGDEAIIKTAQQADEVKELSQQVGDSAEVTASRVAAAYGGENINSENLRLFGADLKEIMADSELTVEEKINYVNGILSDMGLTLEDVGLKAEDFGTKTQEAFELDTENFTVAENLEKLDSALQKGTIDMDEYHQHLKNLCQGELDWSVRTEQVTAKLYNFEVSLYKSKGTLNEMARSLGSSVSSFEDYQTLMTAISKVTDNATTKEKAQQSALLTLGKQYDYCESAVKKYEAALRGGTKAEQQAAATALDMSARSAENAEKFDIEAGEVEALAESYMNLKTWVDENGNSMQMNAEIATDLAARDINLNEGIANLQQNWESYEGALTQLQSYYDPLTGSFTDLYSAIEGQGDALDGIKTALADVLNITDSASISNEFLAANADLVTAAMNGEEWAVEALQLKLAEGLQAEIFLDDSQFQEVANSVGIQCENLADWLQNLPEGQITGNDLDFVQKLVNAMYQAGLAQEDIENKLSGLGIDLDTEPFIVDLNNIEKSTEELAEALNVTTDEAAQMIAENLSVDSESVSSKGEDSAVHEAEGWDAVPKPITSTGYVPSFTTTTFPFIGPFPVPGEPIPVETTFPGMEAQPKPAKSETKTEKVAIGLKVKAGHHTSGGNVSHKNISGGNKPSSSGGSRSNPSRGNSGSTPKPTTVSAGHITPTTKNVFTKDRHDQMTHERNEYEEKSHDRIDPKTLYESVEDYTKVAPKKILAKIAEDQDEVYTKRKKFRHERYEKDVKVDEKEYETKEASMFKRVSEEVDQYHDINKVLENIGNKLDEINQRKSRAFGKAHIDAINEEKAALEQQLEAQNQYLTQMANDRLKLQEQMKNSGWEFDENGDVSNYVQKKTQDVLDYNQAMEKWVDDTNTNRQKWNEEAHAIADDYNATNRAITDAYNTDMDEITSNFNTGAETLDNWANDENAAITETLQGKYDSLAANKNAAIDTAYSNFNATVETAVAQRNADIDTNVQTRETNLTDLEDETKTKWYNIENTRDAEHTANEDQYDTTMTGLENSHFVSQNAIEDQRQYENDIAIRDYYAAVNPVLGTYSDNEAGKAAQDYVKQRDQDLADARKIIDNDAQNNQKLLDGAYKNARADEEERAKQRNKEIEHDANLAFKALDNQYKIDEKKYETEFKDDETISKKKLSNTIKTANNALTASVNAAEEAYDYGIQQAEHISKVAYKRVSNAHKKGIDELEGMYDDEAWAADQRRQDAKEAAEAEKEAREEANDKALESAQKLTDLAKTQGNFVYEENTKMLDGYESLGQEMAAAMLEAQEIRNKLYDNALEVIDYTLNLKVDISNQVMVALQALLDALGTSADLAADRIANLAQQMSQFEFQTSETRKGILKLINSTGDVDADVLNRFLQGTFSVDDLDKIFNADEFTADKIEMLKSYRDNLVNLINEQRALKQQMFDNVNGAFNEYQSNLGLQIEKITNLTKITETYRSIVGIVGKDVLDASGELSKTLAKSAFETQRDQTHTYKFILDEIDSNIADMKQKQSEFAVGSEMYKDFQTQIDQMEATRRSAQDNWLSSWQAEMQAATDYYSEAIDTITMHLEKSMAGLIGSLDLLSNEYDRQKQISEIYVEDYEKIYQLNKLNRDVQNALDDSDHIKNKQQLKKLQQEINAANEDGVKMSQYDLDVLRKKFELELAREELEESRNAKSQVRMMRDAEGNYGYVYTADANAVADAEQNYEDKLHELQVLNTNYIKQLEDNYLSLQQNVRDEIASLDISQFETEAEYLAEVDRIQQAALELQERYGQQMDNATNNNRSLYENEWRSYSEMTGYKISADEDYLDKFEETTYSVLTGFKQMQDAKDQFTTSLAQAVSEAVLAFEETRRMQEEAMHDGNLDLEDGEDGLSKFSNKAIAKTEEITDATQKIADEAETMSENFQNAFEQIADSAREFADNYVSAIQPVIDSNLQLLDSIAKIIEHQANLNGQSGDGSGSGGVTSGTRSAGTTWDAFATAGGGTDVKSKIGEYLPFIGALLQYGSYTSDYEGWGTGETRRENLKKVFGEGADQDINNWLGEHAAGDSGSYWLSIANNPSAYSLEAMKKIMGVSFDTGGYTGSWNSVDGKLAMLHEKELVLNKEDTDNILNAVDMVRKITQMIDLNALSAGTFMSDILSAATINSSNSEVLQQEVHITAEFPNATDRAEIIAAFDNLTNLAVQYAGKQNY